MPLPVPSVYPVTLAAAAGKAWRLTSREASSYEKNSVSANMSVSAVSVMRNIKEK
jgi:hypothetical protein